MGWRFRKSFKIAPGVRLNFGKKGGSISFGTKGFRTTFSTSGRTTTSFGIPGTGLSYSMSTGSKRKTKAKKNRKVISKKQPKNSVIRKVKSKEQKAIENR